MRDELTWDKIAKYLARSGAPRHVRVPKAAIDHPTGAGMRRSLGLPVGQLADWRVPHPNCHGLHVREFAGHYTAHVDQVNPNCDLPGHVALDTPAIGGGAALGAVVGLAVGENAGAMLLGAVIGGLLGGVLTAAADPGGEPKSAYKRGLRPARQ